MGERVIDYKPKSCRYCGFWLGRRKGCEFGAGNCYYEQPEPEPIKNDCLGCPYGRDSPCIVWCTKKIMRELGLWKT